MLAGRQLPEKASGKKTVTEGGGFKLPSVSKFLPNTSDFLDQKVCLKNERSDDS